jgi:hypothetical protein
LGKLSHAFNQAKAGAAKKHKQNANSAKTAKNKAEGSAKVNPQSQTARNGSHEAFLAGCTVQRFAGCEAPRVFRK